MSEEIEELGIDKSDWPDGPWKQEPDRVEWQLRALAGGLTHSHG